MPGRRGAGDGGSPERARRRWRRAQTVPARMRSRPFAPSIGCRRRCARRGTARPPKRGSRDEGRSSSCSSPRWWRWEAARSWARGLATAHSPGPSPPSWDTCSPGACGPLFPSRPCAICPTARLRAIDSPPAFSGAPVPSSAGHSGSRSARDLRYWRLRSRRAPRSRRRGRTATSPSRPANADDLLDAVRSGR